MLTPVHFELHDAFMETHDLPATGLSAVAREGPSKMMLQASASRTEVVSFFIWLS